MNIKLKAFIALAAIAIALVPQAEAQTNQEPQTRFTRIAAGTYHSLALKMDGTVVAWGNNLSGQTRVPGGLDGVVAIAAGFTHSLALVAGTNQNIEPAIIAQASGDNILLSWPLSAQDFALPSTTNLTDKNSWTTLTNLPVMMD